MDESFYSTPSIHRTATVMRWGPLQGNVRLRPYIQSCTPLERLAIAQYSSDCYDQLTDPTDLEYVLAKQYSHTVPLKIPAELLAYIKEHDSMPEQAHLELYPEKTQLLLCQYVFWMKEVIDKKATPLNALLKRVSMLSPNIRANPLFQQIFAAKEPGLYLNFIDQHADEYIDPEACALTIFSGHLYKSSVYKQLDSSTFRKVFKYSLDNPLNHGLKPSQLGFPKVCIPDLYDVHPALYLQSVILNDDSRNAEAHVTKWFRPMLIKTLQWTQTDPKYLELLLTALPSPNGRKHFIQIMERYAPDELALLRMCESLYDTHPDKTYADSYAQWATAVANVQTKGIYTELPGLE